MSDIDIAHLQSWIGRSQMSEEVFAPEQASALGATLDMERLPARGDPLPPLWHWIYFRPSVRLGELGTDGHPKLGGFMPPVPLPRRMWAGGSLTFHNEILIGETVSKNTRISDLSHKAGRQGNLIFVTLVHELETARGLALTEEQQIVYRQPSPAIAADTARPLAQSAPAPARPTTRQAGWRERVVPSPVMLFRYSALTFNSHRIHYDLPYARDVEGYSSLVVHGPLSATLLAASAMRNSGEALGAFTFRGQAPLFVNEPFDLCGLREENAVSLWTEGHSGAAAMTATATLRT